MNVQKRDGVRVPADKIRLVWVSNYYDHPLEGICAGPGGTWWRFKSDYKSRWCTMYPLTWLERLNWWRQKRAFEIFVGSHWTYDDKGERPSPKERRSRKPKWLKDVMFNLYYYKKPWRQWPWKRGQA